MTEQDFGIKYEPYVETRSGKKVTFLDPKRDDIDITDIAYALANQCRFNGHCAPFYSVAEHSVAVSSLLPPELQLAGLLHDAAEAYLGDIPSPIKQFLGEYCDIEDKLLAVIMDKYNVTYLEEEANIVKQADLQQLRTEAHYLIPSGGEDWTIWTKYPDFTVSGGHRPKCAPPQFAYQAFMLVFNNLTQPKESPIILAA